MYAEKGQVFGGGGYRVLGSGFSKDQEVFPRAFVWRANAVRRRVSTKWTSTSLD